MKNTRFFILRLLVCIFSGCVLLLGSSRPAKDIPLAFHGEIMDSRCAHAGTHDDVMRSKGVTDPSDCVKECLKDGAKLVLFSSDTGVSHELDTSGPIVSQDRLLDFAGERVKIVGSLDENSNIIWHIQSIERL